MSERAHGHTSRLDQVVLAVIAANAVALVAGLVVDGHERMFESVHDGIVVFFLVELAARLRAHGWRFLRRPLNAFDAAAILVSAVPLAGVDPSLLRLARAARLVHFARHAGHLRVTPWLRLDHFLDLARVMFDRPDRPAFRRLQEPHDGKGHEAGLPS
jgi:Ion transport protein